MRRLLILLLGAGLVWLGIELFRRTDRGRLQGGAVLASGATQPAELRLDEPASTQGAVVLVGDAQPPDGGRRYVEALRRGDREGLDLGAEARARLAAGSQARYAFEVLLATGPEPGEGQLQAMAEALAAESDGGEVAELMAAAVSSLCAAKRPELAPAALGGRNTLLGAPTAARAQAEFLDSARLLTPEAAALALSAWVDALTRGRPTVFGADFELLRASYGALQGAVDGVLFTSSGAWKSRFHEVRKNESLDVIARRAERELGVPLSAGLLGMVNRIQDPLRMPVGLRLRLPTEPIWVLVEKSTYAMKVFLGPLLIRVYEVGLGENDCTPEAVFTVVEKEENPAWTDPRTHELIRYGDARNPLGDYFVKLAHEELRGFGLHGTIDKASIGTDSSLGCIRLRSKDIKEVFAYLPRGTKVTVRR